MILNEGQLFDLIKKYILPDLKESEDKMSTYDCYSEKYKLDLELKCRRTHYDDLVIEKMKYDNLVKRSSKYGTTPIYVNATPKGIWAFIILELPEPIWSMRMMPKTTDFTNNEKIEKEVGYYDISVGRDISTSLQIVLTIKE